MSHYREWRTYSVTVNGAKYMVASKPGVFADGRLDPSALLLAEHVEVAEGSTVVHLNCGNGLLGVSSSRARAGRIILADRNIVSAEATKRTLGANGVADVEVVLGHGSAAIPAGLRADVVTIRLPEHRLVQRQLIADAFTMLEASGRCYIAGATNEGVKTASAMLERIFGSARVLARDSTHRVVSAYKLSDDPATADGLDDPMLQPDAFNQIDTILRGTPYALYSRPGVFSWDHADEATTILAEVMQVGAGASVLDLGCGYGALGVVAAMLSKGGQLCMVDADSEAIRSAKRTADANGVTNYRALVSDVASAVLDETFDVVVTNPPFHVGKATEFSVPLQFIDDAWRVLLPGGHLFLVANRTLPYEQAVKHRFGNVTNIHDGQRFKVLTAVRSA